MFFASICRELAKNTQSLQAKKIPHNLASTPMGVTHRYKSLFFDVWLQQLHGNRCFITMATKLAFIVKGHIAISASCMYMYLEHTAYQLASLNQGMLTC